MSKSGIIREIWEKQKKIHAGDRLYGTAAIGTKGQVVIPAEARKDLGFKSGDKLLFLGSKSKGAMVIMKSDKLNHFLGMIMKHISGSGLEKEVAQHFQKVFGGKMPPKTRSRKK